MGDVDKRRLVARDLELLAKEAGKPEGQQMDNLELLQLMLKIKNRVQGDMDGLQAELDQEKQRVRDLEGALEERDRNVDDLLNKLQEYQSAFDEQKSKDRKKNLNDDKDKTVKEQLNKIASEKQRAETALGSATKTINDLRAQKERLQAELARARQEAKDARVDRDHALQAAALSLQQASAMGANGGIPGFDHEWSMIAQLKQQLEEETKKLELERAGASKAREQSEAELLEVSRLLAELKSEKRRLEDIETQWDADRRAHLAAKEALKQWLAGIVAQGGGGGGGGALDRERAVQIMTVLNGGARPDESQFDPSLFDPHTGLPAGTTTMANDDLGGVGGGASSSSLLFDDSRAAAGAGGGGRVAAAYKVTDARHVKALQAQTARWNTLRREAMRRTTLKAAAAARGAQDGSGNGSGGNGGELKQYRVCFCHRADHLNRVSSMAYEDPSVSAHAAHNIFHGKIAAAAMTKSELTYSVGTRAWSAADEEQERAEEQQRAELLRAEHQVSQQELEALTASYESSMKETAQLTSAIDHVTRTSLSSGAGGAGGGSSKAGAAARSGAAAGTGGGRPSTSSAASTSRPSSSSPGGGAAAAAAAAAASTSTSSSTSSGTKKKKATTEEEFEL